jgi:RHS repeat-associated protein
VKPEFVLTTIGYDVNSNLTTYTLPTATTVIDTMIYNQADQLTSITDKAGATAFYAASYTYNPASQLITDTSAPTAQAKFHYTALNQLCYAGSANSTSCPNAPTGSEPFAYDAADNLVKLNTTTQQFNAADQLCWSVSGSSSNACTAPPTGATAYTYDSNGNRTAQTPSAGAATCDSYDQANRLVKVTTGSGASCTSPTTLGTYSYNGSGLRMGKTVAGVSTTEAWDLSGGLPLLLEDKTSSATVDYVFGPGGVPLEQIGTATLWYHHDQLGSTRALTNASGVTQATYQYDPYGNLITSSGSVTNPFMYSGQYKDGESGLYYLRARYFDPTTAQFQTVDPAVASTRSPYGYVAGNPLNATDPSGQIGFDRLSGDQVNQLFAKCSVWGLSSLCFEAAFCSSAEQCHSIAQVALDDYNIVQSGLQHCTSAGVPLENGYMATPAEARRDLRETLAAFNAARTSLDYYNAVAPDPGAAADAVTGAAGFSLGLCSLAAGTSANPALTVGATYCAAGSIVVGATSVAVGAVVWITKRIDGQ